MLGIIGAGPSGLALSLFVQQPHEILEASDHVGGHAASVIEDGYTFDYGPHILFSKDKDILQFLIHILGDNVSRCRRNNKIAFKQKLVKYPFENALNELELEDNFACIHDFLFNTHPKSSPKNMKEWFLGTFGNSLCEYYLFPYNEKVWNVPIDALSMSLCERIPAPDPTDLLKSALGYSTEGYLHQLYYHYPKIGGYQAISEALLGQKQIEYHFKVKDILVLSPNRIIVRDEIGREKEFSRLVSTMPVHQLIHCFEPGLIPTAIIDAVNSLVVNKMVVVSLGIKGNDFNQYTAVYFADRDFLVNRVSFPATFSPYNVPDGHWSIQAEITLAPDSPLYNMSDAELLLHVQDGLIKNGILAFDDEVVYTRIDKINESYVVYTVGYEKRIQSVRAFFASMGIDLLGRFGNFDYINIDMAVERALWLSKQLNNDERPYEAVKLDYLTKAAQWLQKPMDNELEVML